MAEETATAEENIKNTERVIYELGYHIVPAVGEEGLPKEVSVLKEEIEKLGGTFISEEFPTHVTLAYTMVRASGGAREKFASAYFGWLKFEMDPEQTLILKEKLAANENVLRYLLFKTVREDTRAPKRVTLPPKPSEPIRPKFTSDVPRKTEPQKPVSDEELDRTIEKLIVE